MFCNTNKKISYFFTTQSLGAVAADLLHKSSSNFLKSCQISAKGGPKEHSLSMCKLQPLWLYSRWILSYLPRYDWKVKNFDCRQLTTALSTRYVYLAWSTYRIRLSFLLTISALLVSLYLCQQIIMLPLPIVNVCVKCFRTFLLSYASFFFLVTLTLFCKLWWLGSSFFPSYL